MLNLSKLKPRFWDHHDAATGPGNSYFSFRRKWLIIVVFTTLVTLTPLLVMALVDYRLTRQAVEAEFKTEILRMVANTRRSVSFMLSQRRAVLAFIARDNTLPALLAAGRLDTILNNLRSGMAGVVDLGVVDAACRLQAYAGPYALRIRKEIPRRICFDQAVAAGFFIGNVVAGEGRGHQLIMAIRHDLDHGGFFVLRATLAADLLDDPVEQLVLDEEDDAFIVNSQGILQTRAKRYGNRLDAAPLTLPSDLAQTRVLTTADQAGRPILMGIAPIADSPFTLLVIRQQTGITELWLKPRIRLIGFLIFSVVLIIVSILGMATYLVNRIHTADQRRVQALHQVEYANKLASIGRLASGVAHEVNNPLAIINQKAGLIKDLFTINRDHAMDEKLLGLVDDVLASVKRCGTITRRLLDFARHMDTSVETVDVEAVIRQILAFMEKEAQRRCIAMNVSVQGRIPTFESDRGNLQQIILNLVNNAFAAMTDGGRLDIAVRRRETDHLELTVSDTGHGIPAADLKRIFEPFFSTRQGPAGTGLGLSITYGMVSEMGGRISVDSQVNHGTTFTLVLPLNPPRPSTAGVCALDPRQPPGEPGPINQRKIP
jgi:signal transduction histidine kinase